MKNHQRSGPIGRQKGFSLVELTIVLVIVALLSGGLMMTLSSQRNQAQNNEALSQLQLINDALLGFAMTNGRLPCPADPGIATASGAGSEDKPAAPNPACNREHGVVPWQTLGIKESDPWGNRFTYFVGHEFADPLSNAEIANGLRTRFTLSTAGRANILDGLGQTVASNIPSVIVSHGSQGAGAYQSDGGKLSGSVGDEAKNADADLSFVSHTPTSNFDDLVSWIVPTVLMSRMVAVGKLP